LTLIEGVVYSIKISLSPSSLTHVTSTLIKAA